MKLKILSIILLVITALGGILMLTSCKVQPQNYTLKFVTTPLYANQDTNKYPYNIQWDETTFSTNPSQFNAQLARTAVVLSSSAYKYDQALDNLAAMGFSHNAKFNYSDEYDQNGVGIVIAERKLNDTTIVAVALRGTFNKEWYSNFDIGKNIANTQTHHGFMSACDFAMDKLDRYLANYGIDKDHTRFLITGHSRGAAVANLMAKSLIDTYGSENVYAYTFATPNTTTSEDVYKPEYSGIFNFVNPEDFIAHIPLERWGFKKYGTTIVFSTKETDENYEQKLSQAGKIYEQYKGRKFKTYDGTDSLDEFIQKAYTLAPTVKDYYDTRYEIAGLKLSLYEYMMVLAHVLNEENLLSNGLILLGSDSTQFEPLKDYMLLGMDINPSAFSLDYDDSLLSYAHTCETYLAWLEVYINNM